MTSRVAPKCDVWFDWRRMFRAVALPRPPFGATIHADGRRLRVEVREVETLYAYGCVVGSRSTPHNLTRRLSAVCMRASGDGVGDWRWLESAIPFVLTLDEIPELQVVAETCRLDLAEDSVRLELWCR